MSRLAIQRCSPFLSDIKKIFHKSISMIPPVPMSNVHYRKVSTRGSTTVYPKVAKRSIPCAPLLSLNGSRVIIAAAELLAYNKDFLSNQDM